MKKIYLLLLTILTINESFSQSWPFVGGAGQGLNAQFGISAADILVVSDNEIYTSLFQTDAFAGNKSLKIYNFNGTTWSEMVTLSQDAIIGRVYLRKSNQGTLFVAYSKLGSQSNYNIFVKKLSNGNFISIGDSLPLTSGVSYFGFEINNNENPIVIGSKSSILDPLKISTNTNGIWAHTTVPNSSGVTFEENNTLIDNQNRLIFMYSKSVFLNGSLVNSVMIDTLYNDNTISSGSENITTKFMTFCTMLHDASNNITILNRENVGSESYIKTYTLSNSIWSESEIDTVPFVISSHVKMSASGKIMAASSDGKISVGPNFTSILSQPNTSTACYKITCNGEKGYAIYGTGIVSGDLNSILGLNKSKKLDIVIYPNPTKNYIYINSQDNAQTINVYSRDGRVLIQSFSNNFINLESLQTGFYIVEVISMNGDVGRKTILKQ